MEIYVNNLAFGLRNLKTLEYLKNKLMKKFNMKDLGKVKKIIR